MNTFPLFLSPITRDHPRLLLMIMILIKICKFLPVLQAGLWQTGPEPPEPDEFERCTALRIGHIDLGQANPTLIPLKRFLPGSSSAGTPAPARGEPVRDALRPH
jgi:hypothetical protein